jgi:hypothetical protein
MGLCYKCAAPWTKEHKCAPEVLLAIEAVWNDYDHDDVAESSTPACEADEQVFLAISKAVVLGNSSARTVWFARYIQGQPVHILIDSNSSASFHSETVANQLSGIESELISTRVQVAGDSHLQSLVVLRNVPWLVGQCAFQSTFRVLPLKAYDAIVGMDWLESFSPIQVHWCDKWLLIPYQGQLSLLQGLDSSGADTLMLQLCAVSNSDSAARQQLATINISSTTFHANSIPIS